MKYSKMLRIWHWCNAVVIMVLLSTLFLRETFLSVNKNIVAIMNVAAAHHLEISKETARAMATSIMHDMWLVHIAAGFALALLLIFRIFIFIKEGISYVDISSIYKNLLTITYTTFYVLTFFMVISGIILYQSEQTGMSDFLQEALGALHESVAWFFILFVPIHIVGVILHEMRTKESIISKMIAGDKKITDDPKR